MSESITANVGRFGKVTGFTTGNVAEFRGVPFATIPARFRRAQRITSLSDGSVDATKYGPYPPQAPEDNIGEEYLFGEYVKTFFAEDAKRTMSEEDCLNLNIVAPKDALGKKKLPVMVWLHGAHLLKNKLTKGGAFSMGANSKKFYHGANLVEHSIKWNEPIVYVAVNYRLGFFGFLASKELAKDNAAHEGGVGNYGVSHGSQSDHRYSRPASRSRMGSGEYRTLRGRSISSNHLRRISWISLGSFAYRCWKTFVLQSHHAIWRPC